MYEYAIIFLFTLYVTASITRRLLTEVPEVLPKAPAVLPKVLPKAPSELKCTEYTDTSFSKAVPKALTVPKEIPKEIQYVLPSVSLQKHEEYIRLKMQWDLLIKN